MVNLLKIFFILLISIYPIVWLTNYPGEVKILWKDFFVETSVIGLAIVLFFSIITSIFFYAIYSKIISFPRQLTLKKKEKFLAYGNKALIETTKSLVLGNNDNLKTNARLLKKYYGDKVFSTFILAQVAFNENNFVEAKKYLGVLKNNEDGKEIALKLLANIAIKENDIVLAEKYLKEAHNLNPNNLWIINNLSKLYAKGNKWQKAVSVFENIKKLENVEIKNNKASFLIKSGANPVEVFKVSTESIPVALSAIKFYITNDEDIKAYKILKLTWKKFEYLDMVVEFMNQDGFNVKKTLSRYKLIYKALRPNIDSDETKIALATVAFEASLWGESKGFLEKISENNIDSRVVDLWQKLEIKSKRITIPKLPEFVKDSPKWNCSSCQSSFDEWEVICKNCKEVGTLYWPKSKINNLESRENMSFFY